MENLTFFIIANTFLKNDFVCPITSIWDTNVLPVHVIEAFRKWRRVSHFWILSNNTTTFANLVESNISDFTQITSAWNGLFLEKVENNVTNEIFKLWVANATITYFDRTLHCWFLSIVCTAINFLPCMYPPVPALPSYSPLLSAVLAHFTALLQK